MNTEQTAGKGKSSALVVVLYVLAAIMAVIFIFMLIANIAYINNYLTSYGMGFGDMWMDGIQYIISGSVSYIAYGLIFFSAAKIIAMVQGGKPAKANAAVIMDAPKAAEKEAATLEAPQAAEKADEADKTKELEEKTESDENSEADAEKEDK